MVLAWQWAHKTYIQQLITTNRQINTKAMFWNDKNVYIEINSASQIAPAFNNALYKIRIMQSILLVFQSHNQIFTTCHIMIWKFISNLFWFP